MFVVVHGLWRLQSIPQVGSSGGGKGRSRDRGRLSKQLQPCCRCIEPPRWLFNFMYADPAYERELYVDTKAYPLQSF